MSNTIPEQQNTDDFRNLILAASSTYNAAKIASTFQCLLALSAIGFSQYASYRFANDQRIQAIAAAYSFGVLYLNSLLLEGWRRDSQRTGAKIQEIFDTRLLGLPWNVHRVGSAVATEKLNSLMRPPIYTKALRWLLARASLSSTPNTENWYPPNVGRLPLPYAALVCQRSSLYWDSELRRNLSSRVKLAAVLGATTLFIACVSMQLDINTLVISVLAPTLPLAAKLYLDVRSHEESAKNCDRARDHLEAIMGKLMDDPKSLSDEELREASRRVQDELYDHRSTSSVVPQWFYLMHRKGYEDDMNSAAKRLVEEIELKLATP